jgi:hypothetical protein
MNNYAIIRTATEIEFGEDANAVCLSKYLRIIIFSRALAYAHSLTRTRLRALAYAHSLTRTRLRLFVKVFKNYYLIFLTF